MEVVKDKKNKKKKKIQQYVILLVLLGIMFGYYFWLKKNRLTKEEQKALEEKKKEQEEREKKEKEVREKEKYLKGEFLPNKDTFFPVEVRYFGEDVYFNYVNRPPSVIGISVVPNYGKKKGSLSEYKLKYTLEQYNDSLKYYTHSFQFKEFYFENGLKERLGRNISFLSLKNYNFSLIHLVYDEVDGLCFQFQTGRVLGFVKKIPISRLYMEMKGNEILFYCLEELPLGDDLRSLKVEFSISFVFHENIKGKELEKYFNFLSYFVRSSYLK